LRANAIHQKGLKWAVLQTDNEAGCRKISPEDKRGKKQSKRSGGMQKIQKDRADVLRVIREKQSELARRFSVRRIGVFGSFVRGSASAESDVDILVDLAEPTFDHYMDLKFYLEEILDVPVDLVMADTVKPRLRPIIGKEVVYA
jgi:predicted nucleotidyltransferase